jgi:hypothetical protein
MTLTSPISGGNQALLRDTAYSAVQYLSLNPNDNIYTAQLDSVAAGSVAEFEYINGSGTLADVWVGMTILISHTNDKSAAYFRGRIRAVPDADTFFINETAELSQAVANDYVFVINDIDLWDKLPREASGVRYNDWGITFRQLPPVIANLKESYADFISGAPSGYTIRFQPTAIATTDGAAISSYQFTLQTGAGTVTAGALNSNDVTIRFNEGFWITRLVVTDDGGRTSTRYIPVHAHGDTYTPELGFTGASISVSGGVWGANISSFDDISSILDNTHATIWSEETYGSTSGSLLDNVNFVGRLRTQATRVPIMPTALAVPDTRYEIESMTARMARVNSPLVTMLYDTTPTLWDEIDKLTPWRGIVYALAEFSTFFHCCSLSFDDTTDTYLAKALDIKPGPLLEAIRDFAWATTSRFETDGQGRFLVSRDERYLDSGDRSSTVVMSFDRQDFFEITSNTHDHTETVGYAYSDGGVLDTSDETIDAYASIAPGSAHGIGQDTSQLNGIILTADSVEADAQDELNALVGHHIAAVNPNDTLSLRLPDGYHIFPPSWGQIYDFTITADDTNAKTYTTGEYWFLKDFSFSHSNETGSRDVTASFVLTSIGVPGIADPALTYGDLGSTEPVYPGWSQSGFLVDEDEFKEGAFSTVNPWLWSARAQDPDYELDSIVTFAVTGSYPWTIEVGVVDVTQGNPAPGLRDQPGAANPSSARMTLPGPSSVFFVRFDLRSSTINTIDFSVTLYDEDDNLISTPLSAIADPIVPNTWETRSSAATAVNVSYLIFSANNGSNIHANWIDNLEINFG